jgi:predicted HicB family RNase H-like nuclease
MRSFAERITLIDGTLTEGNYSIGVVAKKGKHGGFRPGSGRKPILSDPKAIKVSLDGELHDRLTEAAQERGTSVGALVREAIAKHLPKRHRRRRKQ